MSGSEKTWFLYVVSCSDNTLYTGITVDLKRRVQQHNLGKGAAYTATRRPVVLQAAWSFPDQSTATKAEYVMKKRRSRQQKERLVTSREAFQGGKPLSESQIRAEVESVKELNRGRGE